MTLVALTMVGSFFGGLGGGISSGPDGLVLGSSIGFVIGATIWSATTMAMQWQHERRLNRYFDEMTRQK